jgi:GH24 family phage-related lysozyme (muramidase)
MTEVDRMIEKEREEFRKWIEEEREEVRERLRDRIKDRRKDTQEEIEHLRERFGEADRLSAKGAEFIAKFEGFPSTQPYNDPVGFCTAGYGHLLHRSVCTDADRREWSGITQEKARDLLRRDMRVYVAAVLKLIDPELNQPQLDALASFTMNNGVGSLEASTLRRRLNAGEPMDRVVQQELPRWVNGGSPPQKLEGLVRRRAAEVKLFTTGNYG